MHPGYSFLETFFQILLLVLNYCFPLSSSLHGLYYLHYPKLLLFGPFVWSFKLILNVFFVIYLSQWSDFSLFIGTNLLPRSLASLVKTKSPHSINYGSPSQSISQHDSTYLQETFSLRFLGLKYFFNLGRKKCTKFSVLIMKLAL